MITSSNGNIFHITVPFVRGIHLSPVDFPQKGQWCWALMFSFWCAPELPPLLPPQHISDLASLIARFMGPSWGPSGADRTQVGPMSAPWTLLSGMMLFDAWVHLGSPGNATSDVQWRKTLNYKLIILLIINRFLLLKFHIKLILSLKITVQIANSLHHWSCYGSQF